MRQTLEKCVPFRPYEFLPCLMFQLVSADLIWCLDQADFNILSVVFRGWISPLGSGISCSFLPSKASSEALLEGQWFEKYNNTLLMCYTIQGSKRDLQKHCSLDAALILAWSRVIALRLYKVLFSSNGRHISDASWLEWLVFPSSVCSRKKQFALLL